MKRFMNYKFQILTAALLFIVIACQVPNKETHTISNEWKSTLKSQLGIYGHRNWILIVDKAFPSQTANGITTIDTNEDLLPVLEFTLAQIDSCKHVKPIIYTDKELNFITKEQVVEIESFRVELTSMLGNKTSQVLLHDSVFTKIDRASKLFNVMVLKTNQLIPYSSVFIQLDCKYWSADKEKYLRKAMAVKEE